MISDVDAGLFSLAIPAAYHLVVTDAFWQLSCYCSQQVLAPQFYLETFTLEMVNYSASLNPYELLFSSFLIYIAMTGQQ